MNSNPNTPFLETLQEVLNLDKPLDIRRLEDFSLVLQGDLGLWAHFSYQPEIERLTVTIPLSFNLPKRISGLQSIMIKLVDDLLKQKEKVGKLSLDKKTDALNFTAQLKVSNAVEFKVQLSQFLKDAKSWRSKILQAHKATSKPTGFHEEEILDFSLKLP